MATAWDGVPVENALAQRVEDRILPKMQALVELAEADDEAVVQRAVADLLKAAGEITLYEPPRNAR